MSEKMSINDYINIIEYNNNKIPKNIHKIKKKAINIMNNKLCKIYCNNKKLNKIKKILNHIKFKSKNKYYLNNTVKKKIRFYVNKKSTRNVSPLSLAFINII